MILMDRLDPDIFAEFRMKIKTCFASCPCPFKSSGLISCLDCTSDLKVNFLFCRVNREKNQVWTYQFISRLKTAIICNTQLNWIVRPVLVEFFLASSWTPLLARSINHKHGK